MDLNKNNMDMQTATSDSLNLKKSISIYTRRWIWFVLSGIVCIVLAFFYLRYTTPEYNAYAKIIMLIDEGNSSAPGSEILRGLNPFPTSEGGKSEDEIEVLKSRRLMESVVKRLSINIQYFLKGRINDTQLFPDAPIKINFIASDSIVDSAKFNFYFDLISDESFDLKFQEEEAPKRFTFGKNVETPIGDMIITPNDRTTDVLKGQNLFVTINPVIKVAENYKKKISISQVNEFSKVINLSLNDQVKEKAQAIINTLVSEYNKASIEEKNMRSKNAADFIEERINLIASDLSEVDDKIEQFKTGNKLTNITSEADLFLNSSAQTEQELSATQTELNLINYMKDYVDDDGGFEYIPSNVGMSDPSITNISSKYNELLRERNGLLKGSTKIKNPIIVNLDQQLTSLRESLRQSLNNLSKTTTVKIRSLQNQSSKLNSKIFAVPGQVRKSRDIEREQQTKESLYLYLLEKREEATISLTSTSPNAKIIDAAYTEGDFPVFPKKKIVYLAALILGFCIPFSIIYVTDLLDTRIHNKEDLEQIVKNITVLGEIPRLNKKEANYLVQRNDRSILSESFRIIRTNFDYVRRGREVENYGNVIFVTSTINSEGKSFFSMNMALTLANTDKRVLLIGADIRNPQIFSAIKNKKTKNASNVGLTEYLTDKSILVGEAINTFDINDNKIDVLLSGKMPPNPAELLMSDRMKTLFDKVSGQYDYVIVDTAPAMLVTDTLLFSKYAGHTFYLTRAGYTEKRILNFAKELHADKKLNGMMLVVNDVKQSNFGYGAKYGYYGAKQKKSLFKRNRA